MSPSNDKLRHYGCHECREDAELVMSDRATPAASDLYHGHIRECRECRRMHRLLYALYEGPIVPAAPAGVDEEKQFHAALRRSREERPAPWYHKLSMRAGVAALAGSAAVLGMALFDIGPGKDLAGLMDSDATVATASPDLRIGAPSHHGGPDDAGGIEHPAQSYGRIIGGHAKVSTKDGEAITDAFGVGTRFEVAKDQPMQVGLAGKLVANFTPGTDVTWTAASPILLELELERGIAAIRYDRKPSDPILQVRTPDAVVRVVGTVFTVQVEDEGDTRVSVLRGQVEVLSPSNNRQLAELESGFRYDVHTGTFADVGLVEVAAAMPLSNDRAEAGAGPEDILALADGRIPDDWHVPGLPSGEFRTLEYVPAAADEVPDIELSVGADRGDGGSPMTIEPITATTTETPTRRARRDDGQDIIEALVRDTEASKRQEMLDKLEACRSLYYSPKRRYRAAACLSSFISKYGNDPAAAEGYLLTGMLRMDYALDYKAAEKAFETFLKRAPKHSNAEVAHYRMWLAAVEDGRISVALQCARKYLSKYPDGRYVGRILQRFPELKSELR